jgi:L-serine deaminase
MLARITSTEFDHTKGLGMDIHIGGRGGLGGAQEVQGLAAAMASVQLANHATGGHISWVIRFSGIHLPPIFLTAE